jgi:hypothetical protein
MNEYKVRSQSKFFVLAIGLFLISACAPSKKTASIDQVTVEYDLIYSLPKENISYNDRIKPILEKRCVVCHGCYDAPCQLKLSSPAGIRRGSNKTKVYNGERITAADPTRLFIDAVTTSQWRQKNFTAVLNENNDADSNNPVRNLENSVLYRMLLHKEIHPQPRTGILNKNLDLSLGRKQSCPTISEFDDYAAKNPDGGMPFAMPNLKRNEYNALVQWIAQGAPMPADEEPSVDALRQIKQWELFLNGPGNKEKLVARYIFEHLFQAHLHFKQTEDREFYRLIRSSTPPGSAVDIIPTRRPYGDPNGSVYYRIVRHQGSIIAKDHMVYELSKERLKRFRQLFFEPSYEVSTLPSYDPVTASNPIKTFAELPLKSRYQFLLDEARFFVEGFIKGPVCRGQAALNIIEDQFWVVFFDPEAPIASADPEFMNAMVENYALPSELGDNLRLLSVPIRYRTLFRNYVKARDERVEHFEPVTLEQAMEYLWDGDDQSGLHADNKNPNAALTIFRHLDSASVNFGWIGDYPETAWIVDYPLLERIHYLLVAGYDVYGNIGMHLNARLYMDFLRTEGEDFFLAFLPPEPRKKIRDSWYQGIRAGNKDDIGKVQWLDMELVKGYQTEDTQRELFQTIENYLDEITGTDYINRCKEDRCRPQEKADVLRADKAMQAAQNMNGKIVQFLPDVAFVRVGMDGEAVNDLAYTMIYNKAYKSVSSFLETEKLGDYRDYHLDSLTIVRWLEGSYPNFFYVVALDKVEAFVEEYNAISNLEQYHAFIARYGIRRTNEEFWQHADWFTQQFRREQPVISGVFDLNRYQNR